MKHEENNRNNKISETSDFLHEKKDADQMFQTLASELDLNPSLTRHSGRNYFAHFVRRRVLKAASILTVAGLLAIGGVGLTEKPAFSSVKAAPSSDSSSARVTFQVDALFPVRDVNASLNEQAVSVDALGKGGYAVDVTENGYLLLEVVSLSGMRSSQGVTIDSIDDQAPVIVSHTHAGDEIRIHVRDVGDAGIDYSGVYASGTSSGRILPESCDASRGLIVFRYPSEDLYITIPDRNGNRLISLLQPGSQSGSGENL